VGIAIVWFAVNASLGASGFFAEHRRFIFLFVLAPMIIFAVAFAILPALRAWALALDTRALVFAQAVRTGGAAFLSAYAVGSLNGAFALWAGSIDVVVGLSAPFAAQYLVPALTARRRRLLIAWMALGILDFAVAIPLAATVRAVDPASMTAMTLLPLCMISTFFVPVAVIDYLILATRLLRQRNPT
jgi:hypothetical protein